MPETWKAILVESQCVESFVLQSNFHDYCDLEQLTSLGIDRIIFFALLHVPSIAMNVIGASKYVYKSAYNEFQMYEKSYFRDNKETCTKF